MCRKRISHEKVFSITSQKRILFVILKLDVCGCSTILRTHTQKDFKFLKNQFTYWDFFFFFYFFRHGVAVTSCRNKGKWSSTKEIVKKNSWLRTWISAPTFRKMGATMFLSLLFSDVTIRPCDFFIIKDGLHTLTKTHEWNVNTYVLVNI